MKLLLIAALAFSANAYAGECLTCDNSTTTVDALVGDMVYAGENQPVGLITTRAFVPPAGYKMVLVAQPPTVTCTETEQPDIWQMVSTAPVRKYNPARVTAAEEAELKAYLEAGQ